MPETFQPRSGNFQLLAADFSMVLENRYPAGEFHRLRERGKARS